MGGHTVDKSPIAKAMFYMYTRFEQLSGYVNDAQFCIAQEPAWPAYIISPGCDFYLYPVIPYNLICCPVKIMAVIRILYRCV